MLDLHLHGKPINVRQQSLLIICLAEWGLKRYKSISELCFVLFCFEDGAIHLLPTRLTDWSTVDCYFRLWFIGCATYCKLKWWHLSTAALVRNTAAQNQTVSGGFSVANLSNTRKRSECFCVSQLTSKRGRLCLCQNCSRRPPADKKDWKKMSPQPSLMPPPPHPAKSVKARDWTDWTELFLS